MSDTTTWFDIQERLAADSGGAARGAVEQDLQTLQQALKRKLDAGVPPAEFERLTTLLDGVTAAGEVVANIWRSYHTGRGA